MNCEKDEFELLQEDREIVRGGKLWAFARRQGDSQKEVSYVQSHKKWYDEEVNVDHVKIIRQGICLFVCLLLNGTLVLIRPLLPRTVEVEHVRHVKNDL